MYKGLKLTLIFVIFLFQFQHVDSQVGMSHLRTLLSSSDQKTLDKIEIAYNKGKNLENEANIIKSSGTTDKEKDKNSKKYTLKRLEAAQVYQKANADLLELFKNNVGKFWKENKNSKVDPSLKNYEDKANELSRNAKSTRKVAEDLTYPDEKLSKMMEAENLEAESINIFTKVLYAYLNYPITYDSLTKAGQITETISKDTVPPVNAPAVTYIEATSETKKDTVIQTVQVSKDTTAQTVTIKKDTIAKPVEIKKDTIVSKPKVEVAQPVVEKPLKAVPQNKTVTAQKQVAAKDSASLYNMMQVKEEQVDKFNKFLEDKYPNRFENYVINFRELNYGDFDSLRSAWTRYNQYQFTPEEIASLRKTKKDSSILVAEATPDTTTQIAENTTQDVVKKQEEKTVEKKTAGNTKKTTQATEPLKKTTKPAVPPSMEDPQWAQSMQTEMAKGFIYRVQISACRIPIDAKSLRNIYSGGLKILELHEDNWYKYAIGEFNSYAEARHLRDAVKIPGAFVIAYLNGKRIQILNPGQSENYASSGNLTYKVQIAAAKIQLNKNYITNIYAGPQKVEENLEDGWYKYSIVIGNSLASAKKFIEDENIPGAFITSYLGGKKIELKEALKIKK